MIAQNTGSCLLHIFTVLLLLLGGAGDWEQEKRGKVESCSCIEAAKSVGGRRGVAADGTLIW